MKLLGESCFDPFGDSVSVSLFGDSASFDTRLVHGLRETYDRLKNHFGHTRWCS
jgi:hypothetical protein